MDRWRRTAAMLLILTGVVIMLRGTDYALRSGGWRALLTSVVIGGLVIALGVARLNYWRQR